MNESIYPGSIVALKPLNKFFVHPIRQAVRMSEVLGSVDGSNSFMILAAVASDIVRRDEPRVDLLVIVQGGPIGWIMGVLPKYVKVIHA